MTNTFPKEIEMSKTYRRTAREPRSDVAYFRTLDRAAAAGVSVDPSRTALSAIRRELRRAQRSSLVSA